MTTNCPLGIDFSSSGVMRGRSTICSDWLDSPFPLLTEPLCTVWLPSALDNTSAVWLCGAKPPKIVPARSVGLLPLSRLRTVREGFPSYSSSISSRFRAAFQENRLTIFMDVGHITHFVLAAHGQRNLVENFPFIADFHGQATVITTTMLIPPNLLKPT